MYRILHMNGRYRVFGDLLTVFMESSDMVNITVDRLFSSLHRAQGDKKKLSAALITKLCLVMLNS